MNANKCNKVRNDQLRVTERTTDRSLQQQKRQYDKNPPHLRLSNTSKYTTKGALPDFIEVVTSKRTKEGDYVFRNYTKTQDEKGNDVIVCWVAPKYRQYTTIPVSGDSVTLYDPKNLADAFVGTEFQTSILPPVPIFKGFVQRKRTNEKITMAEVQLISTVP